jgi:hypothetical protein
VDARLLRDDAVMRERLADPDELRLCRLGVLDLEATWNLKPSY